MYFNGFFLLGVNGSLYVMRFSDQLLKSAESYVDRFRHIDCRSQVSMRLVIVDYAQARQSNLK